MLKDRLKNNLRGVKTRNSNDVFMSTLPFNNNPAYLRGNFQLEPVNTVIKQHAEFVCFFIIVLFFACNAFIENS